MKKKNNALHIYQEDKEWFRIQALKEGVPIKKLVNNIVKQHQRKRKGKYEMGDWNFKI